MRNIDARYDVHPCPICNDPWCTGCEECLREEADMGLYIEL